MGRFPIGLAGSLDSTEINSNGDQRGLSENAFEINFPTANFPTPVAFMSAWLLLAISCDLIVQFEFFAAHFLPTVVLCFGVQALAYQARSHATGAPQDSSHK